MYHTTPKAEEMQNAFRVKAVLHGSVSQGSISEANFSALGGRTKAGNATLYSAEKRMYQPDHRTRRQSTKVVSNAKY
jgi:hypothetical protein